MRALWKMDTIQIEITNACINSCSNCTRLVGHSKPYFMTYQNFIDAMDSLLGFPQMIGIMGGEPLLHPSFKAFCRQLLRSFNPSQLGLWTCFPEGKEDLREVICETFGHIFLNDHSRPNIYHAPVLVGAEEVFEDKNEMFRCIDNCWVQECWSASINPKGAYFCEVAAALAILFNGSNGWRLDRTWWQRTPKDFTAQIEEFCPKCGCAVPLGRRSSQEGIDDISPFNYNRLKNTSPKIKKGMYEIHNLQMVDNLEEMAQYKDKAFRSNIAARYGIFLVDNIKGFQTPHLMSKFDAYKEPLFDQFVREYGNSNI